MAKELDNYDLFYENLEFYADDLPTFGEQKDALKDDDAPSLSSDQLPKLAEDLLGQTEVTPEEDDPVI